MTDDALSSLLADSFEQYQVMWNDRRFHTHTSHHLGSLHLLGANEKQLKEIYEKIDRRYSNEYEVSPHEINDDNWRESFGDTKFCLAYRDYFLNKLLNEDKKWQEKMFDILLDDSQGLPLIDGVLSGLFHPLIHLDYAIELNSRLVACETLTMTAVVLEKSLQKTVHDLKAPIDGTKQPIEVLKGIYADENTSDNPSFIHHYYNQWKVPQTIDEIIEQLFDMSVYIYGTTHRNDRVDFSFIFLHLLTGMHAIRKIQSYFNEDILRRILYGFFYSTISFYIQQQQPMINEQLIDNYNVENEKLNWNYVIDKILNTKLATEVHLVKVIRALRDGEHDYGQKSNLYLKTAVKTIDNLNVNIEWDYYNSTEPWIGTAHVDRQLNIKKER